MKANTLGTENVGSIKKVGTHFERKKKFEKKNTNYTNGLTQTGH